MSQLTEQKIENWSVYNALTLSLGTCATLFYTNLNVLLYLFAASLLVLIYLNLDDLRQNKFYFGIANGLTLCRFLILFFCFYGLTGQQTDWFFYSLCMAVLLDFFDGKAARYFNETSFFGQYFDMEMDAFYVLLMCCFYYLFQDVAWWILIPGLLRYVFRLYTFLFPKENIKETKKSYATIVAASYFLILLFALKLPAPWQVYLLMLGSLALVTSFTVGFVQYHKV